MKKILYFLLSLFVVYTPLPVFASVYTTDFESDPWSDWSCVSGTCSWFNGSYYYSASHAMYPQPGGTPSVLISPTTTNSDIEVSLQVICEGSSTDYVYGTIQGGVQVPLGNFPSCSGLGTYQLLQFTGQGTNIYIKNSSAGNSMFFDDITVTSTEITTPTPSSTTSTADLNRDVYLGFITVILGILLMWYMFS